MTTLLPVDRSPLARAGFFIVAVLGAALIASPWLAPREITTADRKPIVLKAGHTSNTDEPYHQGLLEFARIVEERSDGQVSIQIYPSSQLGNERMMIEGLLLGTLDIVVTANGSASSFVPQLGILDLPFLFRDRQHLYEVLDGDVGAELRGDAAARGFRILGFYDAGVRHIMTRERPVESLEDLREQKIRTMPVPAHLASFNAFGAQAVAINYGEMYGSLQTGLIDGAEAANTNFTRKKFYEVAPNWAQVGWIILVANMVMSEEAFNALPTDVQQILRDAGEASARRERVLYRESDEALLSTILAQGVKVTYPDTQPFRDAAAQIYPEFVVSDREQALLRMIQREGIEP
ncbi:MAG: TRAP transporter substrate-binding protein [Congregibacter sp.]